MLNWHIYLSMDNCLCSDKLRPETKFVFRVSNFGQGRQLHVSPGSGPSQIHFSPSEHCFIFLLALFNQNYFSIYRQTDLLTSIRGCF